MDDLILNGTNSLPAVFFNRNKGILTFTGKSLPEDSISFYKNIERALDELIIENPNTLLVITCEFEYINTSSSKALYNVLKRAYDSLESVSVVWGYEEDDEDMLEQGKTFEEALGEEFEYRVFYLS